MENRIKIFHVIQVTRKKLLLNFSENIGHYYSICSLDLTVFVTTLGDISAEPALLELWINCCRHY
jgi:hypothetical protein